MEILAGFVMGFAGSIPLAGPVALLVMTRGIAGDLTGAKKIALGAGVAEGLLAGAVFAGLGILYSQHPDVEVVIGWLGSAALLSIGIWFLARGVPDSAPEGGAASESRASFSVGFLLVAGNPGMIGTWGGALAALEGTGLIRPSNTGALALGVGVTAGVSAWFLLMLKLIQAYGAGIKPVIIDRIVRCLGLVIALAGAQSVASHLRGGS